MINLKYNIPVAGTNGTAGFTEASRLIENKSYFEPRLKALQFNGVDQYLRVPNFNPTKELGYTYLIGLKTAVDTTWNNTSLIFKSGTNTRHILGRSTFKHIRLLHNAAVSTIQYPIELLLNSLNIYTIQEYFTTIREVFGYVNTSSKFITVSSSTDEYIGWDECTDIDTIFMNTNLECHVCYLVVYKGILEEHYHIELINNTFLNNPSTYLNSQYSLELFVDFNNPYYDASTSGNGGLKFPDLSPNNHDIIAEGWTDLEDLQSNLIDINELRFNIPAGALLDETGTALRAEDNIILEED